VDALVDPVRQCADLDIRVDVDQSSQSRRGLGRLAPDVELAVYRVVQEALTNVARHAGAQTVELTIHEDEELVAIAVRDDGCGFDPATDASGFGLVGMRERLAKVSGTLQVESEPGRGTAVTATVPVTRANGAASVSA
jgi:signal transduction histidine kinase